jgi:hypothetical protein
LSFLRHLVHRVNRCNDGHSDQDGYTIEPSLFPALLTHARDQRNQCSDAENDDEEVLELLVDDAAAGLGLAGEGFVVAVSIKEMDR